MSGIKLHLIILIFLSKNAFSQKDSATVSTDSVVPVSTQSSVFYVQGSYLNSFRTFEDNTPYGVLYRRNNEAPISTGGFELGTHIELTKHTKLSLGVSFFSGGEDYSFSDTLTDSTFYYKNKYRQVGIPLKLNFIIGSTWQAYGFAGVIPSSILHRQYSSDYTTVEGEEIENDVEVIKNGLASFQLVGSVGLGARYQFSSGSVYAFGEYRQNLTNTYLSDFVVHRMRAVGFGLGVTMTVN